MPCRTAAGFSKCSTSCKGAGTALNCWVNVKQAALKRSPDCSRPRQPLTAPSRDILAVFQTGQCQKERGLTDSLSHFTARLTAESSASNNLPIASLCSTQTNVDHLAAIWYAAPWAGSWGAWLGWPSSVAAIWHAARYIAGQSGNSSLPSRPQAAHTAMQMAQRSASNPYPLLRAPGRQYMPCNCYCPVSYRQQGPGSPCTPTPSIAA